MYDDKLSIHGMTFHAYHGCDEGEIRNGQRFEVDIDLFFDSSKAAKSDSLDDTIDVRTVFNKVHDVVTHERYDLIESISQHIADELLQDFNVSQVMVRVKKPFAPLGGLANGTTIEIVRRRE